MPTYNLIDEHLTANQAANRQLNTHGHEYVSTSPNWILMIVRYKDAITSSKARMAQRNSFNTGDVSLDDDSFALTGTKSSLIITGSCVSMNITSQKGSFSQNLNAVLKPGKTEFLSAITPGDWCFAWMMNTEEKYKEVLQKLREGKSANEFDSGLKFVGRVQDIRKTLVQSPGGPRTVQYNFSGLGFGELDSSVFFDPFLARREAYLARHLQDMNISMRDIYQDAAKKSVGEGGVSVNSVIPVFLTAFLGKGLSGPAVKSGVDNMSAGAAITSTESPYSYVIPQEAAAVLGVKEPSKAVHCYADILEVIQGLQKYEEADVFETCYHPIGTRQNDLYFDASRHVTSELLKGTFLPVPTSFDGKSVWNLLNEYLNPAINEMYTAMKYTPSGRIMPTLIVRQLPFSSPILHEKLGRQVTAYHELPRWKADEVLIRSLDIGRSDGGRTNFVHIYAEPSKKTTIANRSYQIVEWPPISDSQDIKRHGLRPHMGSIQAAAVDPISGGPSFWMKIKADFLLGQHMMLNGQVSLTGITVPIVPGDNFEFDDILYHIESVNHHAEISQDGKKVFSTQLTLTHGVRADIPAALEKFSPQRYTTKARAHQKKSLMELGDKVRSGKDKKNQKKFEKRYGSTFAEAKQEEHFGPKIEVGEHGENLDIYLYSGIDADDNRKLEPGVTIVDVED